MADVEIRMGPVSPTDTFKKLDRSRWKSLVREKRSFARIHIPHDCRCLLQFIEEAEDVWEELGYSSLPAMIKEGYDVDPSEAAMAYEWLKMRKPEWAVPFADAVKFGTPGGDRKSEAFKGNQDSNRNLIKGGTNTQYTLARLERDHPELLARVKTGELSCNAAAIEAGFRKVKTPPEQVLHWWKKCSDEERRDVIFRLKLP